jgi:catechol 2,3-dioxygenase-like lactoylglutathione lyase family enzyme
MTAIRGAHHTSFTVPDLQRSLDFFQNDLGLEVVVRRVIDAAYFGRVVGLPGCRVEAALLRLPGSEHLLELFEYVAPRGQPCAPRPCDPGSSHLALLVDDLPALYERLCSRANFVSAPVAIDAGPNRGGLAAYLREPGGILIELLQLPAPGTTRPPSR